MTCPNPACRAEAPLVNSFTLSRRQGKAAHVKPIVGPGGITYTIEKTTVPSTPGTVARTGAHCLTCDTVMPLAYVRAEGKAGRLGARLLATVAEGVRGRVYLPGDVGQEHAAAVAAPGRHSTSTCRRPR